MVFLIVLPPIIDGLLVFGNVPMVHVEKFWARGLPVASGVRRTPVVFSQECTLDRVLILTVANIDEVSTLVPESVIERYLLLATLALVSRGRARWRGRGPSSKAVFACA